MSERFCPFCGRANRSDLPRCMNCGQRMMPAVPPSDSAKATAGGRSVLLHPDDEETQTVAASRTSSHEPWWRSVDGSPFGAIPPPPQIKEEMERFAAREEAKASAQRAEEAAKEATLAHERKQAAAALARAAAVSADTARAAVSADTARAAVHADTALFHAGVEGAAVLQSTKTAPKNTAAASATQLECERCGTAPPPGGGFSFCLSCGGDLTGASPKPLFTSSVRPASPSVSASAPGVAAGLRMSETSSKTNQNTGIVSITSVTNSANAASTFPPGVAALLSFFVPGIGQIVNGQVAKGVVLLLASFFVTTVLGIGTMGLFPLLGRIVAALDAYRIAEKRRKGKAVRPDEWDF